MSVLSVINDKMPWLFHHWLALFGILLFVFKDCQSLFLRHIETGKCITVSEELVYDDPSHAFPYYVVMTDNCLEDKADFRYLDSELLHNIEEEGTLVSTLDPRYNGRWTVYNGISTAGRNYQQGAEHRLKQTVAGYLSFYNKINPVCAEPDSSNYYVLRKISCGTAKQKFTFGSVTAFNAKMENVHCSPIQRMMVRSADYGEFNNSGTFNNNAAIDSQCSKLTNCQVKSRCDGNRSCELTMDNNLLPSKYCSDTSNQIYTKYTCVDTYSSSAITTAPNIRLTWRNIGYIEIKDGSVWKKVVEENWNKKRQKALCQYLGFEEIDSNTIESRRLTRQQIVTGDLICYNTQPRGTSCCVHLKPSTSTTSTSFPYVRCKICNNPLLREAATFPDSVFSGSGDLNNKYKDARITKGGWCPSGSSSAYLLLDLQKEYHLTQVVVMTDRAQTKWSRSYSLKYSHDTSYRNNQMILGNQNGYQASRTNLDIYNVRYVKIESNGNQDFCLRIELCGEVQVPAPVSKINVLSSKNSAYVTWEISTSTRDSSYITQIIIHFSRRQYKMSRRSHFNITNLRPYTQYTVGIQAQDGSSETSQIIYENFRTNEAAPSGPPLNVIFTSRGKNSLKVSWQAPNRRWNGHQKGYEVCLSVKEKSSSGNCSELTKSLSYKMSQLLPSTKYFVTVSAATSAGNGPKSEEVSKITNGEPVNPVVKSQSSLGVDIAKPAGMYIKEVMVIVQIAPKSPTPVEAIKTDNLKPYQHNTQDPYITAYFKTDILPSTFVIGDGKEYNNFKEEKYINQPLEPNSSYTVFLRFFETMNSFFSTEWSSIVKTPLKPPVPLPVISKILSTARKKYTISWIRPTLPVYQTLLKYYVNYRALNGFNHSRNISKDKTSITIDVEYEEQYIFEIQVVTQAGISGVRSKTWFSHSAPLEMPTKTSDGYTIKLRKPREEQKIKNVTLVVLKLESENPPAPEDIQLQTSPPSEKENNVAFKAKVFDITEFQEDTIEISLQQSKEKRRRKRNAFQVNSLAPASKYRAAQMNTDESGNEHWSYWTQPFTSTAAGNPDKRNKDDSGGGSVGVVVAATVAAVVIVLALVLAVIYFRRRKTYKQHKENETGLDGKGKMENNVEEMHSFENDYNVDNVGNSDSGCSPIVNGNNEDIYSNETGDVKEKARPPVPIAEFSHYVNELKTNDNCEFQKQYDDLPKNMKTSWEVAKKPFNKKKNRYGNIVTYDYCRVVLSGDENEDYINASYIDGIKENSYIASQGPNKLTVDDMWRMVWEQRSYSIVMVTSLVELGKPKCEKYWPDKGTEMYGDIEVTLLKIEEFAYHVSHTLQLKKNDEVREVRHYYFQSWPDHGVPKYPTQLLAFRRQFRTHHLEQSGPIIVHCSAGVGRTGVFLAIDTILDKLEKGVVNSIDVFGEVCAMRERRMIMVQTLEQYIFIHEAILETILCGMNEVDSSKIEEEIEQLAEIKASGMTGFQEKFKRLGEISPKLSPDECTAALLEGNSSKNRNKNICPAESNRVPLQYVSGVENSDYINAVFVHGFLGRNYFIATQSPLPNTINDFWRLVHSQKSSTIVLLNNVKDGTSVPKFWPTERGKPTQYDSLTVQLESEKESDGIWTRKFILSPYPDLSDGQVVNIFHHSKWPDHRVPPDAAGVITLTSLVENSRKSHGHGPIIVACSDGAGRTGTYIAISNLLERMKIEQTMDVFQSIKIIRGTRPQFVENAEQYQFCYTAVMAYLDAFSEYANFD